MKHRAQSQKNTTEKELFEWLETIAYAVVIVVLTFTFAFRVVKVDGPSMTPTLLDGQRVIVTELFYKPEVGDVVVVCVPGKNDPYVKRIIATEGQTVDYSLSQNCLVVDGTPLEEEYINEEMTRLDWYNENVYPVTLKEGEIFVCGDNRNHSSDSRYADIGPIDTSNIMGKVAVVLTPFSDFGLVK